MSTFEIVIVVVAGLFVLTLLYALIRVAWRLRQGDLESAGRDSETWKRN
jgi:hypothetical protein